MPSIHFLNDELTVEVKPGTTLSSAAHRIEATLPFGCRAGTCGTCALIVERGLESLDDAGLVERDTLDGIGMMHPCGRLGCQIILGRGDLAVRWE